MKKILVLEDNVWGHHLEYMSHLYHKVSEEDNCELIFVVPHTFDSVKNLMVDKDNPFARIEYMTDEDYSLYHKGNYLTSSWNQCKVLRKYALKYQVDECFLIMLVSYLPLLPFFLPRGCKASGILYRIYFYAWNVLGITRKLKDVLEFFILSIFPCVNNVYLLNDKSASAYANRLYRTKKFEYLPDPINVPDVQLQDMRKILKIEKDKRIFLHFGVLTERKGTLMILEAIEKLEVGQLDNMVFIFAGRVYNDIKEHFYMLLNKLQRNGVRIIVFDEFCSYEHLTNLVAISNVILVPYSNVTSSSGVIGYAAKYNVPVIGPKHGLLGKLIRKYKLGVTLDCITSETLAREMKKFSFKTKTASTYTKVNTVRHFTDVIFKNLKFNFNN